ncbi:Nif3-like dinuclear metal center hexameric protein [Schumannella luteola]|uniref:GTP cyclohydrolase 1 type 2 homolog n=1 Tax=Schumannella luteola TaxID=472059 RepID=A0A852YFA9_9MICO|nr:Nif3-like dinuclear metal center hexameric protein [Schumannella luteola]NYG99841.1 dinuclear metal center YbgI/SA1388 family protein [Schumannella luteola]TPX02224.1 Nif3-like dinuclear metal center hexameric protein [Schumannella luteola]
MPTLADVTAVAERLWPAAGTESWDAPGLLAGVPTAPITRIHLALDATVATAREAVDLGAELLLVHHPLLLRGVTSVAEDRYKGAVIGTLLRGGCALLAAHTNADVVPTGTSAVLADRIGLRGSTPLVAGESAGYGLGRVGELDAPETLRRFAQRVGDAIPATVGGVRVAGDPERLVRTVALCAGAGDSLLTHPAVLAADVYLTSDLRHHPASEAIENAGVAGGPALVDIAHWAAESLWLDTAAAELRRELPGVETTVSALSTDPWTFRVD